MKLNEISDLIIKISIEIHKYLGPGLFESVYEAVLEYEINKRGFKTERQTAIPIKYKNIIFNEGFRADLIVNDQVIIEVKSVKEIEPVHIKQLLTYLRLSNKQLGLIINFNKELLKSGIKRVVNGLEE